MTPKDVYYNVSENISDYLGNSIFLCFAFLSAPESHNPPKSAMAYLITADSLVVIENKT